MTVYEHNRQAWDALVQQRQRLTIPASDSDFENPLEKCDSLGWLGGNITGKKVLCLAAGGGKHGPLYAAAGAQVTVLDISPAMLEQDKQVACQRGFNLRLVTGSMDDLTMFAPAEFEIVIHPVSTCYVPDIAKVYAEVARVTCEHGIYVSQHKTPTNLQAEQQPRHSGNYEISETYYRTTPLPAVQGSLFREEGTLEYLHTWESILGSLCRSGFVIEDLVEPQHASVTAASGSFEHRCLYIAPYVRIKARRIAGQQARRPQLIMPE
jgi:ubiquinone/menaquinone biosynthesis C-methylase UbiE